MYIHIVIYIYIYIYIDDTLLDALAADAIPDAPVADCTPTHLSIYIYIYMYVCVYMYMNVYTHIYIYMETNGRHTGAPGRNSRIRIPR